jgi:hypothetical protein
VYANCLPFNSEQILFRSGNILNPASLSQIHTTMLVSKYDNLSYNPDVADFDVCGRVAAGLL